MHAKAYLFEQARDVLELIDALGAASTKLSLLMTDRTAEKEFSLEARALSEVPMPLNEAGTQLARALHPLAALGAPGSGLVGVGTGLENLHGAGLGSYRDLPACLAACGIAVQEVQQVIKGVRGGGVLVLGVEDIGGAGEAATQLIARARQLTLQFPEASVPATAPILAPVAPAGDQHAGYTPAVTPPDEASRNLEER